MYNFDNIGRKRKKVTFYQQISKLMQTSIKNTENKTNLIKSLKKNINNLKYLNTTQTRYEIEKEKYENPVYFFEHNDLVIKNKYCYYAKLIGYIDVSIAFFIQYLAVETEKQNLKSIKNIKNNINKLSDKREELISELENTYNSDEDKILINTLKHYPSYEKFNDLYKRYNDDFPLNCILVQLVTSYNIGYSNVYNNEMDEVFETHIRLQNDLKSHKNQNIAKYSNTAVKIRAKKFH